MKKIIEKKFFTFILAAIGIFSTMVINAQWQNKASGFSTPQRGIVELICVANETIEHHLRKGDYLGACCGSNRAVSNKAQPENLETGKN